MLGLGREETCCEGKWVGRRIRFDDQLEARSAVEGADWADQEFIHGCDARTQNVLKSEKWKSEKWKSEKWKSKKWKVKSCFMIYSMEQMEQMEQ